MDQLEERLPDADASYLSIVRKFVSEPAHQNVQEVGVLSIVVVAPPEESARISGSPPFAMPEPPTPLNGVMRSAVMVLTVASLVRSIRKYEFAAIVPDSERYGERSCAYSFQFESEIE